MSAATKAHIFELLEKAIKAVGQAGNDVEMVDAEG